MGAYAYNHCKRCWSINVVILSAAGVEYTYYTCTLCSSSVACNQSCFCWVCFIIPCIIYKRRGRCEAGRKRKTCDTHSAARTWPAEPPGHGLLLNVLWLCVCPPQREADLQQTVVSALAPSPQSCQPHMPRAKRRRGTWTVRRRSGITSRDGGGLQSVWVCLH